MKTRVSLISRSRLCKFGDKKDNLNLSASQCTLKVLQDLEQPQCDMTCSLSVVHDQ